MGVKSTTRLTRSNAEAFFVQLFLERKRLKKKAAKKAKLLSNKELEDKLEKWNDEQNGGEGFQNYIIDDMTDDGE